MNKSINIHEEWLDDFFEKFTKKLERTSKEIGAKFPYTTTDGKYEEFAVNNNVSYWTNGFWPGMMWLMYVHTKNNEYLEIARKCEDMLDEALEQFKIHHDVGFMWLLTALADYVATGNEKSKTRALHAATILAGRFNLNGNFIRAWDVYPERDCTGWAIIDCLLNVPLLYWASRETKDPRFTAIAKAHTNTVMHHFVREDFSVNHIVGFCPETGVVKEIPRGQGYATGSAWSRGQSWAVYGFTLGYMNTKDPAYLSMAKNIADYVISNLDDSGVPVVDYKAPGDLDAKDTTAGAITACGLIELSKYVADGEKYLNVALKMLKGLYENCDFSDTEQSILQNGTEAYHDGRKNIPIIYGDYYLLEALMKLKGEYTNFWCADIDEEV